MGQCGSDHPHILDRRRCKWSFWARGHTRAFKRTDKKNYNFAFTVAIESLDSDVIVCIIMPALLKYGFQRFVVRCLHHLASSASQIIILERSKVTCGSLPFEIVTTPSSPMYAEKCFQLEKSMAHLFHPFNSFVDIVYIYILVHVYTKKYIDSP